MFKHVKSYGSIFIILTMVQQLHSQDKIVENYEVYVREIISSCSKEIEKELSLICIGDGGRMPRDVEKISMDFVAYRKATIDEARILEIRATELLLKTINNHQKIRFFLREYPFKANRAHVSILFNKKDNTSYTDGSVAFVTQAKDKIHYFTEDGISPIFIPLAQEPYEEAANIVHQSKSQ